MYAEQALIKVQADLCARIDGIAAAISTMTPLKLCEQVDGVRRLAQQHGFRPVAELAGALESTMATGERGVMVLSYLDLMREAAASDRRDAQASGTWLAAASVRMI